MSEPVKLGTLIGKQFKVKEDGFTSALRFADCLLCPHTKYASSAYGLKDGTHCNGNNMEQLTKLKESKCPIGLWK